MNAWIRATPAVLKRYHARFFDLLIPYSTVGESSPGCESPQQFYDKIAHVRVRSGRAKNAHQGTLISDVAICRHKSFYRISG